jgi:hypothetical protein
MVYFFQFVEAYQVLKLIQLNVGHSLFFSVTTSTTFAILCNLALVIATTLATTTSTTGTSTS